MAAAYSLWIDSAQRQGLKFRTSWNGSLYELDSWAIVKGAQHLDDAYRFIAFASRPENQKIFSDSIAYGPTNKKAIARLAQTRADRLPRWGANLKASAPVDAAFWIEHGAELEKRFEAWAPPATRMDLDDEDEEEQQQANPPRQ